MLPSTAPGCPDSCTRVSRWATAAQMTMEAVKAKLSTHCGTPVMDMRLHLRTPGGGRVALLSEDHRMLGFYSPQDGCACLHKSIHDSPAHVSASCELSSAHATSCGVSLLDKLKISKVRQAERNPALQKAVAWRPCMRVGLVREGRLRQSNVSWAHVWFTTAYLYNTRVHAAQVGAARGGHQPALAVRAWLAGGHAQGGQIRHV